MRGPRGWADGLSFGYQSVIFVTARSSRAQAPRHGWLTTRGASQVASQRAEHRGWLSHGLAALAISALGLAVAGSVSLTTSAQPIAAPAPPASAVQTDPAGAAAGHGRQPASPAPPLPARRTRARPRRPRPQRRPQPRRVHPNRGGRGHLAQRRGCRPRWSRSAPRSGPRTSRRRPSRSPRPPGKPAAPPAARSSPRVTAPPARPRSRSLRNVSRPRPPAGGCRDASGRASRAPTPAAPSSTSTSGTDVDARSSRPAAAAPSPVPGAVIGAHFGQYGLVVALSHRPRLPGRVRHPHPRGAPTAWWCTPATAATGPAITSRSATPAA